MKISQGEAHFSLSRTEDEQPLRVPQTRGRQIGLSKLYFSPEISNEIVDSVALCCSAIYRQKAELQSTGKTPTSEVSMHRLGRNINRLKMTL